MSEKYERILYEKRGVAGWIIFNVPEQRNCINPKFIAEVSDALGCAEKDLEIRAVVLTGTGPAFCAGADLKGNPKDPDGSVNLFLKPLTELLRRIRNSPLPVIAAVNGFCLAGGMETLVCCDMVVAARSALFGDQHAMYGLLPAIGGAQGLMRSIGVMKAKELMLTGGRYSAEDMRAAGLVGTVVADEQLHEAAQKLADAFADKSPGGIARMKQMLNNECDMHWESAAAFELAQAIAHSAGPDMAEGRRAFAEKRKPVFMR